jgi:hypothetical protein
MKLLITGLLVVIICTGCAAGKTLQEPYQSLTCDTLKVGVTWQTQCW